MFEQAFETSATPHITVTECLGDLVVRRGEEQRVTLRLRGGMDDVELVQEGETITLSSQAGCFLTCPAGTTLTIESVHAKLKVKEVQGSLAVDTVHGSATLDDVGPTELEQVHGNLGVRDVSGHLKVERVLGNARIREVKGLVSMNKVAGSLRAGALYGGLEVEKVAGSVRLGSPFTPGSTYRLNVDGSLRVFVSPETSLRMDLQAGGSIRSGIPGLKVKGGEKDLAVTLGEGEAVLEAEVGGSIRLQLPELEVPSDEFEFDTLADLEGLGAQIEAHIADAMAGMEAHLEQSLSHLEGARRFRMQADWDLDKAREAARLKADHAAEKARMRAERAERRWRRASGHPPERHAPTPPASDEERMQVLRLVEEGKITPEEATDLLAALEGR